MKVSNAFLKRKKIQLIWKIHQQNAKKKLPIRKKLPQIRKNLPKIDDFRL